MEKRACFMFLNLLLRNESVSMLLLIFLLSFHKKRANKKQTQTTLYALQTKLDAAFMLQDAAGVCL